MPREKARDPSGRDWVPLATYRLQFNRDFTLARARALVPYLRELGISHIYASPLLKAVKGSTHGYDVCDFQELNPELGTPADFEALHDELARHQMGLVLDVVPNHMGIGGPDNRWWWSVLANGPGSQYARCFDIDWNSPDPRLRGKVTMPILTERYDESLVHGSIRLKDAEGSLRLRIGAQSLPVSPGSAADVLRRAEKLAGGREAAVAEVNNTVGRLDEFVQKQNYRLVSWKHGNQLLNYRRFFTITGLAGIRIEDEWVFARVFGLVKLWLDRGWISGLRVDHIDGLRYPVRFLRRLREMAPSAWIVVEKILQPGEPLQPRWPIDGTTGYDFLNNLNGIFIDPKGEKPLTDFYREFTGDASDYDSIVRARKQLILREDLSAEVGRLTDLLVQISAEHWEGRDYTRDELAGAWVELATCVTVYRTYVDPDGEPKVNKRDARLIHAAAKSARQHCPDLPAELFDFLEDLLSLRRGGLLENDFVLRFQQLTGPVMAKAVEDTAFYCYPRFIALNEVGGNPGRFGLSAPAFHKLCREQHELWPSSMSTTATHDTKWSGDVRARLALLSERPAQWIGAVRRWSKRNESKKHHGMPDRKTEYLFYQALVGAWPLSRDRALAYMEKAAREAREHTSWSRPETEFDEALKRFVGEAMEDAEFLADVEGFVAPLVDSGWINSLSQTLIKITSPGVPDFYQGSETWDLYLTDPDNRRPVDFKLRRKLLKEARGISAEEAWRKRGSGIAKIWLTVKGLAVRRRYAAAFGIDGGYEALHVTGSNAAHVLAFTRGGSVIAVTPRLIGGLDRAWADTTVELPDGRWQNVLTDSFASTGSMAGLTASFPVALLVKEVEQ